MTLEDLRRLIEAEKDALRAEGIGALYVFGSTARGEAGPDSDVDFFIDPDPSRPFSLVDLVSIQERLSKRLARPADVHTRDGLHYWIRDRVIAEAVRLL